MKKWLLILGIVLLVLSLGWLLGMHLQEVRAEKEAISVAQSLLQMLPGRTAGVEGEYADPRMPALEYQGREYVAVLEAPAYGVCLPVQGTWKKPTQTPCRYWGSCYDGTMIIGGSSRQFSFCTQLELGDKIVVTDLRGTEFSCSVERIERSKTASYERLTQGGCSLTLFAPDPETSGYILVLCSLGG